MRILLIGGTDLTIAIATALVGAGLKPAACVGIGSSFQISYSKEPITNVRAGDMRVWACKHDVAYLESTKTDDIASFSNLHKVDVCLVAGWFHFLPARLRAQFRLGTWGVHASLLPELRGNAPLNWAILTGMRRTGITLFALANGIDDGDILDQRTLEVGDNTAIGDLIRASTAAACEMIVSCLPRLAEGMLQPKPQSGVPTYCLQRRAEDGRIDWSWPAERIARLVRAISNPYPGAYSMFGDRVLRIWEVDIATTPTVFGVQGQIAMLKELSGPAVLTGTDLICIKRASLDDGTNAIPELVRSNNQRLS